MGRKYANLPLMLIPTSDPKAPERLQNYFLIAATRESRAMLEAVVEEVVRFRQDRGIHMALRINHAHPMASVAGQMFEDRNLHGHLTLV